MLKYPPAKVDAHVRDAGSNSGWGRSPGGGHSNPQYSCLENPKDRRAWWAMVHRVTKGQTRLKRLSSEKYSLTVCSPTGRVWSLSCGAPHIIGAQ